MNKLSYHQRIAKDKLPNEWTRYQDIVGPTLRTLLSLYKLGLAQKKDTQYGNETYFRKTKVVTFADKIKKHFTSVTNPSDELKKIKT